MAKFDLTSKMTKYLDRHLVAPLLEFLWAKKVSVCSTYVFGFEFKPYVTPWAEAYENCVSRSVFWKLSVPINCSPKHSSSFGFEHVHQVKGIGTVLYFPARYITVHRRSLFEKFYSRSKSNESSIITYRLFFFKFFRWALGIDFLWCFMTQRRVPCLYYLYW